MSANAERPMSFHDSLPREARDRCWLPLQSVTLAFWPCGQGYTTFHSKVCRQTKEIAYNVALCTSADPTHAQEGTL